MNKDWFNLKEGWIVRKCIPVVPLGLDLTYPAELQNLCALQSYLEASERVVGLIPH